MKALWISQASVLFTLICLPQAQVFAKKSNIEDVANKKDFEKILRTRTNVLTLFKKSAKDAPATLVKTLEAVADQQKGSALVIQIDCSTADGKKICKKEKTDPAAYILKHYLKGQFNRDYDRAETVKSFLTFLKDPTGEAPWEEDTTSKDVLHVEDGPQLRKFLQEEKRPSLVMFYAPWCGHCKMMKPEYSGAATELKKEAVLAAMDVNKPHNSQIREQFKISGFPTLYYFEGGVYKYPYGGGRTKKDIIQWMRNPTPPAGDAQSGPMDVDPLEESATKEEL
ncbi:Protein disulfide-isomerase A5 [Hypsibius exemplaris]|uniref:Protein disulfide-isomerase A5 n=1 Tax=Hypsibius exemplaris TaxID=2072580 RepID=A0A1W0WQU2_HYPEX|nr:Protein disulfide-isomerase A5 [Hypsibius exemplaris]